MNTDGIDYLGIDRVLKRGSGEIVAETDHALLVRDAVSEALLLACEDAGEGLALLDRHAGGCGLQKPAAGERCTCIALGHAFLLCFPQSDA